MTVALTRITVEPFRDGWAVIISGPGRLPSRVAAFPARYKAEQHAAWLRDGVTEESDG